MTLVLGVRIPLITPNLFIRSDDGLGRIYTGKWNILVTFDNDEGNEVSDLTEPASYEMCEAQCLLYGWDALRFQERYVKRAIIVKEAINSLID